MASSIFGQIYEDSYKSSGMDTMHITSLPFSLCYCMIRTNTIVWMIVINRSIASLLYNILH